MRFHPPQPPAHLECAAGPVDYQAGLAHLRVLSSVQPSPTEKTHLGLSNMLLTFWFPPFGLRLVGRRSLLGLTLGMRFLAMLLEFPVRLKGLVAYFTCFLSRGICHVSVSWSPVL